MFRRALLTSSLFVSAACCQIPAPTVPEGTQSGATFRVRGKGMPDVSGRGRGDLFFAVQAVTPKKLSKEQRAAFEQLGKVTPKDKFAPRARDVENADGAAGPAADDKNIFNRVKDIFG